jgi:hypothetical protein
MQNYLVAICGVLYLGTSIGCAYKQEWGFAVAYLSYSLANVGLIMASGGFK